MNVIEHVERREFDSVVLLRCGHTFVTQSAAFRDGQPYTCSECAKNDVPINREWPPAAALCTDEQLSAVADEYVAIMRTRGFNIGKPERDAIARAAGIQDAWRVAFAKVLKG